uniref:Saposin B-type domain-containing protein n=1 Tax=Heligmosomoides polygyrus TaxID=6339 RepID=A0A183GWF9_HELPZ
LLSCLECKVAAEEGINALIADRNKQSAAVQEFACHKLLPSNFTDGCDDFLTLYLPTVLYMTWEQFTPEGLCTKMKSCDSVSCECPDIKNVQCCNLGCIPSRCCVRSNGVGGVKA